MGIIAFAAIITILILGIKESWGIFRLILIIALICGIGSLFLRGIIVGRWLFISSGIIAALCAPWLAYRGYDFFGRR